MLKSTVDDKRDIEVYVEDLIDYLRNIKHFSR